jgi:hypothetical protein
MAHPSRNCRALSEKFGLRKVSHYPTPRRHIFAPRQSLLSLKFCLHLKHVVDDKITGPAGVVRLGLLNVRNHEPQIFQRVLCHKRRSALVR